MNGWTDGWTNRWMDERMDGRMNGRMDEQMDGWIWTALLGVEGSTWTLDQVWFLHVEKLVKKNKQTHRKWTRERVLISRLEHPGVPVTSAALWVNSKDSLFDQIYLSGLVYTETDPRVVTGSHCRGWRVSGPWFRLRGAGSPGFKWRGAAGPRFGHRGAGGPRFTWRGAGSPQVHMRSPWFRWRGASGSKFRWRGAGSPWFRWRGAANPQWRSLKGFG